MGNTRLAAQGTFLAGLVYRSDLVLPYAATTSRWHLFEGRVPAGVSQTALLRVQVSRRQGSIGGVREAPGRRWLVRKEKGAFDASHADVRIVNSTEIHNLLPPNRNRWFWPCVLAGRRVSGVDTFDTIGRAVAAGDHKRGRSRWKVQRCQTLRLRRDALDAHKLDKHRHHSHQHQHQHQRDQKKRERPQGRLLPL